MKAMSESLFIVQRQHRCGREIWSLNLKDTFCWRSFHFYSIQHSSILSITAVRIPTFFLIYQSSSCQMAFPFCTMTNVIIRHKGKIFNWKVKDSVNQEVTCQIDIEQEIFINFRIEKTFFLFRELTRLEVFEVIIWTTKYTFRILLKKGKGNTCKQSGLCWKDTLCEIDIRDRIWSVAWIDATERSSLSQLLTHASG